MDLDNFGLEKARNLVRFKVSQLIGRHGFTTSDREDLEQELILEILKSLLKFDPRRGSQGTFMSRVLERRIATIIRHRRRMCRDSVRIEGSLSDLIEDEDGAPIERAETLTGDRRRNQPSARHLKAQIELASDLGVALGQLDPDLRQLGELLENRSLSEVASALGVSLTTVARRKERLSSCLEDAGLRSYFEIS